MGGTVLDNCPRCRHPIRPASPPIGAELSLALHGARPYPLGGLQHRLSLLLLELCAAGEFPRPWPWLSPSPTQGSFVRISAAVARRVCAGGPCRRAVNSGSGVDERHHLLHRRADSIDCPCGRGAADRLCVGHGDHGFRRAGIGPGGPPPARARAACRRPGQLVSWSLWLWSPFSLILPGRLTTRFDGSTPAEESRSTSMGCPTRGRMPSAARGAHRIRTWLPTN